MKHFLFVVFLLVLVACGSADISAAHSPDSNGVEFAPPNRADTGEFAITLRFSDDSLSDSQKAVFEQAALRWATIIMGDLPEHQASIPANNQNNLPAFEGVVDDLLIDVKAPAIDGKGQILGQAGPYALRLSNSLPYYGRMILDKADIDSLEKDGMLETVVLHEMGHVLGIGTLWDNVFDLLEYQGSSCLASSESTYKGREVLDKFSILGRGAGVSVEDTGGAGTKCGHWQEAQFANELMTGYLNYDQQNPLSRLTAATLADMGYEVNYDNVQTYSPPSSQINAQSHLTKIHEVLLLPVMTD